MPDSLEAQIKFLEEYLLHSEVRKSPEILDVLLAEDFEEVGSSGYISSRKDVVDWLVNKESNIRWSLTEFSIRELSKDLVLARYRAQKIDTKNNDTSEQDLEKSDKKSKGSIRSSIWRRQSTALNGSEMFGWQMIFHQGTKISS